jgi:hypothetical protein
MWSWAGLFFSADRCGPAASHSLSPVGAVWAVDGKPRVVFAFTIVEDAVVDIGLLADPEVL